MSFRFRFIGFCFLREEQGRRRLLRVRCVLLETAHRSLRRRTLRRGCSLAVSSLIGRGFCSARRRRRIHFVRSRLLRLKKVGGRAGGGPRVFGPSSYTRAGVGYGWWWPMQVQLCGFLCTMIPHSGIQCRSQSVSRLCLHWS